MHLSKRSLSLAISVALASALLTGCGDDAEKAPAKSNLTPAQQAAALSEKNRADAKEQARNVADAETAAAQARRDANTYILDDLPVVEDSKYIDIETPWMPVNLYIAHNNFNEPDELLPKLVGPHQQFSGYPEGIQKLRMKIDSTTDGFEKIDLQTKFKNIVVSEADKIQSARYVKATINSSEILIKSYDFNKLGFSVAESFFNDKRDLTQDDVKGLRYGSSYVNPRSYMYVDPVHIQWGFTEAAGLNFVKVEDQELARKIESVRDDTQIIVYGYVKSIEREVINNKLDRYINIKPQRIDFIAPDGSVMLSVKN